MQYSYESWQEEVIGQGATPAVLPDSLDPSFPISEDLKELERNLSLDVEAGMRLYRHHQHRGQTGLGHTAIPDAADAPEWDDLAKLVADHVLAYMLDNPLQTDLAAMRRKNDQFYEDNRVMAKQVQELLSENDSLRTAVTAAEGEVARFQKIIGNLYLKR